MIEFPQKRQTDAPQVEMAVRRLAQRHARDSKLKDAARIRSQKARRLQVHKEAMHRADRKPGKLPHLLGGKAALRAGEQFQKPQPALKRCDVIGSFADHFDSSFILISLSEINTHPAKHFLLQPKQIIHNVFSEFLKLSRRPLHNLPNFFTASTIDFSFSMCAYIECSLKSISCAKVRTLAACARGTTTTPSASATTKSFGFTATPSHVTGMFAPANR